MGQNTHLPTSPLGGAGHGMNVNVTNFDDFAVTIEPGEITVGAVKIENGVDGTLAVVTAANAVKVDGSAVTQPVSVASVPSHAVTNAGTFAVQVSSAPTTAVTGTFWQATQPVSAASLPLPTSASTAAKQPALGTSSAPSTDVITVQAPVVTQVVSAAFEAFKVLKNQAGRLVQLSVFNSSASAQFILIINAASNPVGDIPVTLLYPPIPISGGSLVMLEFSAPLVASTGITVSNSSTGTFTRTIGASDCAFYAQVIT